MSTRRAAEAFRISKQLNELREPLAVSSESEEVIVIPGNDWVELQRAIRQVSANGVAILENNPRGEPDVVQSVETGSNERTSGTQSAALFGRNHPTTVKWLINNFENAEEVSLSYSTIYGHYLGHCAQRDVVPINAASFGKLIRSVFKGLRTRYLGSRGNSERHYYGIRVKPGSPLCNIVNNCDNNGESVNNQGQNTNCRIFSNGTSTSGLQNRNDTQTAWRPHENTPIIEEEDSENLNTESSSASRDIIVMTILANSVELQRVIHQVSATGITVMNVRNLSDYRKNVSRGEPVVPSRKN